jgi:hypothetical protein
MIQKIKVNLIPAAICPVVYVSQTDAGRTFETLMYDGKDEYTIPDGATVSLHLRKPDESTATVACTYSGNVVTVKLSGAETNIAGKAYGKLWINTSGFQLGAQGIDIMIDEEV